jgi:hypothetical protein
VRFRHQHFLGAKWHPPMRARGAGRAGGQRFLCGEGHWQSMRLLIGAPITRSWVKLLILEMIGAVDSLLAG